MVKIKIKTYLDYISGFLLNCHQKGIIEIPEEDLEDFKRNPIYYINKQAYYGYDLCKTLEIGIDDFEFETDERYGEITKIEYEVLNEKG